MGNAPSRSVDGRRVTSTQDPEISILVSDAFTFIGQASFALGDAADAEAFVFVDVEENAARRMLVVQFERYRDDNDEHYSYPHAELIVLEGLGFLTDASVICLDQTPPPDSDTGRILEMIRGSSHHIPRRAAVQRFIHLPGNTGRSELLLIYAEDTSGSEHIEPNPNVGERARAAFRIETPRHG